VEAPAWPKSKLNGSGPLEQRGQPVKHADGATDLSASARSISCGRFTFSVLCSLRRGVRFADEYV